ncbi:MAG: hypothetical protein CM1200mP11_3330 [Nitrosopumilaceae archaeon]|nr:MAG: hypothetical protein CM1200mP11_3330 [Nitrosopumilaceae archaeon]
MVLKISYEPEITPEQILEKISTFNIVLLEVELLLQKRLLKKLIIVK